MDCLDKGWFGPGGNSRGGAECHTRQDHISADAACADESGQDGRELGASGLITGSGRLAEDRSLQVTANPEGCFWLDGGSTPVVPSSQIIAEAVWFH